MSRWVNVANIIDTISDTCIHNGELYACSYDTGRLLKWVPNAWVVVADLLANHRVSTITSFNGTIYGGTKYDASVYHDTSGGCLLQWNGIDAWSLAASKIGTNGWVVELLEHNSELYGGMSGNTVYTGPLYRWNGTNSWIEVAPTLDDQPISSLKKFNDKIYGGTGKSSNSGKLLEWNGTNEWTEVAGTINDQNYIYSMEILDAELYAGTSEGRLLKWNSIDTWVEVANNHDLAITSLKTFNGSLYGGDEGGTLLRFTGAAWVSVADNSFGVTHIIGLEEYSGKLYGGIGIGNLAVYNDNHSDIYINVEDVLEIGYPCINIGDVWKEILEVYITVHNNVTWDTIKDMTWNDILTETWNYQAIIWRAVA